MKLFVRSFLLCLLLALTPTAFATIFYVDGVHGNDNNNCKTRQTACKTIGHAISLASSGDTIGVGPATYTENLTISISLNVIGSGAATTIIDGGHVGRVVTISTTNAHVTLSRVTIQNGKASQGGGIYNGGTLTISDSTLSGNSAHSQCGSACYATGGGIYNGGTLTISDSTLSGNSADTQCQHYCFPNGGGISNGGTLVMSNSTLSGNNAVTMYCRGQCGARGGGIFNTGKLTVSNGTMSGNSAGGGIYNLGTATLQDGIVANSTAGGNCFGTVTSLGYNLSSDNTCAFNGPGDLNNTDPKLGPLQNNGGPTQTQALLPGSPAIDAGNPNGCTDASGHLLKTDQRGMPRPDPEDTGGCDMGAYESQSD